MKSKAAVRRIVEELKQEQFAVKTVKRTDKQRSPTPPFTTSSLQQEASRKLNMTPRRTMAIAQQLYEGVDITGEGTVGLITYMRTDSLRISEEAIAFVHTPVGTAIKAVTPEELAISIAGEMILVRATRREANGEVHHGCPMH